MLSYKYKFSGSLQWKYKKRLHLRAQAHQVESIDSACILNRKHLFLSIGIA